MLVMWLALYSCPGRCCDCYTVLITLTRIHATFNMITRGNECVKSLYEERMSFEKIRDLLDDACRVNAATGLQNIVHQHRPRTLTGRT